MLVDRKFILLTFVVFSIREFFTRRFKRSSSTGKDRIQDDFLIGEKASKPVDFDVPNSSKSGQMAISSNLFLIEDKPVKPLTVPPRPSIFEPRSDEDDDISVCPICGSDIRSSEKSCSICGEEFE
jgi:hypothetical protein